MRAKSAQLPALEEPQQLAEVTAIIGNNPTLLSLVAALLKAPGYAAIASTEIDTAGGMFKAKVEVRLLETTEPDGTRYHWNVAAGTYQGDPTGKH